jgi:hypothetical protein
MKVKYTGKKEKCSFFVPVGTKTRRKAKNVKSVTSGEVFELAKEDAEKLCSLDPNFQMEGADKPEAKVVEAVPAPKVQAAPKKAKRIIKKKDVASKLKGTA